MQYLHSRSRSDKQVWHSSGRRETIIPTPVVTLHYSQKNLFTLPIISLISRASGTSAKFVFLVTEEREAKQLGKQSTHRFSACSSTAHCTSHVISDKERVIRLRTNQRPKCKIGTTHPPPPKKKLLKSNRAHLKVSGYLIMDWVSEFLKQYQSITG